MVDDDTSNNEEREDILSILRELRPFYFWILIVQIVVWGTVIVLAEKDRCVSTGLSNCIVSIGIKMSALVALWFLTSVILVDIGRFLMVLLPNFRAKIIAKAKAEGKAAGLAEGKAEGKAAGLAEGKAEGKAAGLAEGKAAGIAQGESIGASKMHAKWSAWNTRRIEHERRGEPFDEPLPGPDDEN